MTFLSQTKMINEILNDINHEIKVRKTEFDDIKLDYLVIKLCGEFENKLNFIIENKLSINNNFSLNYINFIKSHDYKLHRGLQGDKFKKLLKDVFGKEHFKILNETEWQTFVAFINFRHAIAHSIKSYQQKKEDLITKMISTDNLINIIDKLLIQLNAISKFKKNN